MNHGKKIFVFALTALLALSLAGCGAPTEKDSTNDSTNDSSTEDIMLDTQSTDESGSDTTTSAAGDDASISIPIPESGGSAAQDGNTYHATVGGGSASSGSGNITLTPSTGGNVGSSATPSGQMPQGSVSMTQQVG